MWSFRGVCLAISLRLKTPSRCDNKASVKQLSKGNHQKEVREIMLRIDAVPSAVYCDETETQWNVCTRRADKIHVTRIRKAKAIPPQIKNRYRQADNVESSCLCVSKYTTVCCWPLSGRGVHATPWGTKIAPHEDSSPRGLSNCVDCRS